MLHLCPTCRRPFDEDGFCPFDGARLVLGVASVDQPTVLSQAMAAQDEPRLSIDPNPTELEPRRGTFPLTPTPTPSAPTQEITAARTRPGPAAPPSEKIRAVSASETPHEALDAFRTVRENEYDKLVGQTLDGRYYVERKIGEGGMGVVFAARHAVIERPLAIKVLKREVMRDTATIRRFVREAKAASRIGHPNIVDITDFGTTPDGMTFSVMEFVAGQTLGTTLRSSAPFPAQRALRIAAQIARALGAAHDKGIVHRDLKPENVFLLDRDGRTDFVKIVDFGIAKVMPTSGAPGEPRLTRVGSVFGTPEYMAPEQAAGRSDTDGRVDIYALGVILYEMICGRVPHRGDSMVRTLAMQMLDPAEPPSKIRPDLHIDPALEAIVMRALAKKREQRFQTMGELLDALDKILPLPIGQSVTGSPVYTLAAIPGGDPGVVPVLPPMPIQSAEIAAAFPIPQPEPSPSKSPANRRAKDEPEFVTAGDKPTFQHVFADELLPARVRRWPLLILAVLIVVGAAGAIALVLNRRNATPESEPRDAGTVVVRPEADAAVVIVQAPLDAAPVDAADLIVLVEPDAGVRNHPPAAHRDAGPAVIDTPNHRGTIMVQVLTKPEGANLYVGGTYRGPGGTQVEEPYGTKLTITCKQLGYKPGHVDVMFDGTHEGALCELQRTKICINNIKNMFDDCEVDPNAPIAP